MNEMAMKMLTKELMNKIPALNEGDETAYVKFFTPWSNWTWFVCEACAVVDNGEGDAYEISLKELAKAGLTVEAPEVLEVEFYG